MRNRNQNLKKAVFIDRDGVINKKAKQDDYIKNWEEFIWLPGVKKTIKRLNDLGWLIIVASNQRGVSRGLMKYEDVVNIHDHIQTDLAKINARIDALFFCPHNYDDNCSCRKPKIGLIKQAERKLHLNLALCFVIGDSESDIIMGRKAGCLTILVLTGQVKNRNEVESWEIKPDFIVSDLSSAVKLIEKNDR